MQVFLCWSGKASHAIAQALHTFLGDAIQELRPFLSSDDIGKGARWRTDIGQQLADCNFGILCMTKENLDSRWILFEAGALSKLQSGHVTALLAGIEWKDVVEPLSQFQHTNITRDDVAKLLADINTLLSVEKRLDADRLNRVFERDWPTLQSKLAAALKLSDAVTAPRRDTASMITEVLELVRELKRDSESSKAAVAAAAVPGTSWAVPNYAGLLARQKYAPTFLEGLTYDPATRTITPMTLGSAGFGGTTPPQPIEPPKTGYQRAKRRRRQKE